MISLTSALLMVSAALSLGILATGMYLLYVVNARIVESRWRKVMTGVMLFSAGILALFLQTVVDRSFLWLALLLIIAGEYFVLEELYRKYSDVMASTEGANSAPMK